MQQPSKPLYKFEDMPLTPFVATPEETPFLAQPYFSCNILSGTGINLRATTTPSALHHSTLTQQIQANFGEKKVSLPNPPQIPIYTWDITTTYGIDTLQESITYAKNSPRVPNLFILQLIEQTTIPEYVEDFTHATSALIDLSKGTAFYADPNGYAPHPYLQDSLNSIGLNVSHMQHRQQHGCCCCSTFTLGNMVQMLSGSTTLFNPQDHIDHPTDRLSLIQASASHIDSLHQEVFTTLKVRTPQQIFTRLQHVIEANNHSWRYQNNLTR